MIEQELSIKVVVIGTAGVGKSSLIIRYVHNEFSNRLQSTLGAVYLEKSIIYKDRKVKFEFWDTAGQEKYRAITKTYYKNCRVALVVFDVSARKSYDEVVNWMEELKNNAAENIVKVIVGNKTDLELSEDIPYEKVQKYAKEEDALFFYTSAKSGKHIDQLFNSVAEKVIESMRAKPKKQKLKKGTPKKKRCC